ncbi:ABC transporter substrate-binding protein [Rhodoferax sp.]|uniref:ABC transporter substrate-binding protein n=1 Tax=Rhodoferax sp. TaxID=50421 RepID=UPI002600FBE5|nr:ABC transporter substrate-binding protein [Rhodoferax sp.]
MPTHPLPRRAFVAAALLAAGFHATSTRAQAKLEKSRLTLAVDGEAALYHLPLTIADQLGYFKAEGLEVEISDLVGGMCSPQVMPGSTADVFAGAFENTITSQAKGQMFQSFVLQGRAPQIALGISTHNMPGYRTLADLRGKKIGVAALGAPSHMVANVVLARAGVGPGEVQFVGIGSAGGALWALRSGQVDAICNTDPVMGMLEQKSDIKIVSDTRTLKGALDVFGGAMPAACVYAPLEFVRRYPNTVQALTNAMVHALKWLQTAGPSDIVKRVPESYFLGDRAVYLAAFNKAREAISPDGLLPEDGPQTAWKALGSFDPLVKAARIDLEKTYTNDFVRRAKERFRA